MSLKNSENTHDRLEHSKPNRKFLFVELFIALSLAVAFFFLVRNYFDYGNPMNGNMFMAGSEKLYRLNAPVMGAHWNERLSGLLFAGALMDYSLNENGADTAQATRLRNVFGAYHACWLLLLFVCIIFSLRHSLFINLGIFAGLIYDFSPASGPYFFPWDVSGMFFFTLAVLLFERRRVYLMMLVILAGAFFNESVLACTLFILFFAPWKWGKRTLAFIGTLAFYMFAKRFLLSGLQIEAPMLSLSAFFTLHGAFSPVTMASYLMENLRTLFAPTLNSVIFANGGTLVGVLVLCWRRRFLPYMAVIIAFLIGLFVIAPPPPGISEVRAFMEVLPLCVILLVELSLEYAGIVASDNAAAVPVFGPPRETFPLLLPLTLAVITISASIAAFQYYIIYRDLQPENQAQSQLGKFVYNNGPPVSLEAVSQWFQNGYADSELKLALISQRDHRDADAINQYERVLDVDTNSIYALNNLSMLLATDSDARLRDGNRAVRLAEQACGLTQYREPALIYTLAAAYAEAGRFNDAVAAAEKAKDLAIEQGQKEMADENEPLVELYKSGRPFHQQPQPAAP